MLLTAPNKGRMEASAAYVEKHQVYQLFEGLLADLLVHKPANPIAHLITALKTPPSPKIVITGPPSADTRSQCELISGNMGLVHVFAPDAWRDAAKAGTEVGLKAKAAKDAGGEIPDDLMLGLLTEKLNSPECASKGWILEGYPTTAGQTRAMLAAGLLPTKVLLLQLDDEEVMRRLCGRRIDPVGNAVYHLEDAPPPDAEVAARLIQRPDDTAEMVEQRLAAYRRSAAEVMPCFPKVLAELDAGLPKQLLYDALAPLVAPAMPSRAPRGCPRVCLLGGPGARAEEVGAALAEAYGARLVSTSQLLHAAALSGSVLGGKVAPYVQSGTTAMVPDKLVRELVLARLQGEDVRQQGFVLVGCPANSQQAAWLAKHGVWVRHAVHLDLSNAAAKRRVTAAKVDPIDGTPYHPDEPGWPVDPANLARLVPALHSEDAHAKKMLNHWRGVQPQLLKTYQKELLTLDATAGVQSLVEQLSGCFLVKA